MISVIVCSVNKELAAQIKRNLDETIGVEWELVLLDNSELKLGICEVYNLGAARARHDLLCFVHEDVIFRTAVWGQKIAEYFSADAKLGLIGIAGGRYKSKTFSGWATGISEFDCCNILHRSKLHKEERLLSNPAFGSRSQNVVTTDGVFMVARKNVWQDYPFNQNLLNGFHLYDIDFSSTISRHFNVIVVYDIDLVHLTEGGDYGNSWVDYTFLWHQAKELTLPLTCTGMERSQVIKMEMQITKKWLHRLRNEKISFVRRLRWVQRTHALRIPYLWPHIVVFMLFRVVKKIFS